jgi:tRNA(Arg) A34 adenosine deaminase TadA
MGMPTDREEKFMRMVLELAIDNVKSGNGGPFAAIVVKGDEVIATGVNQVTTMNDPTAHAEVSAIRAACAKLDSFQLAGCEVYTSCEPCPMCLGALYWARPDHIYFAASRDDAAASGFDDSFIYEEVVQEFSKRNIATSRLLPEEANRPFDVWEGKEDKMRY